MQRSRVRHIPVELCAASAEWMSGPSKPRSITQSACLVILPRQQLCGAPKTFVRRAGGVKKSAFYHKQLTQSNKTNSSGKTVELVS